MKKIYFFPILLFIFLTFSRTLISFDEETKSTIKNLAPVSLNELMEIECEIQHINKSDVWYKCHQKYRAKTIRDSEGSDDSNESNRYIISSNWCGYIIEDNFNDPTPNSIDNVGGTWEVPALNPTENDTYSAIWVGIDGYNSQTVQQMGTSHNWVNGQQVNFAWFQMFPSQGFVLPSFPVEIGDSIGVFIQHLNEDLFFLCIINYTKNVFARVPERFSYAQFARRISAEWVLERPNQDDSILPLADFNTFPFFKCMATVNGVLTSMINPFTHQDKFIFMKKNNQVLSFPFGVDPSTFFVIHAPQ